jgi:hypothetical protein
LLDFRFNAGGGVVRETFRNLATAEGTRAVIDREELLSVFEIADTPESRRFVVDARLPPVAGAGRDGRDSRACRALAARERFPPAGSLAGG